MRPLDRWMRWLLYATGGLFFLTGVQLVVLSGETATYFAWTLTPPIAAATLGAAFLAGAVGQFVAARQRTLATARVAVPWLWVLSALMLVVTVLHFGEFHFSSPDAAPRFAAWLWLATYAGTTVAALLATWVQLRIPVRDPPKETPFPHSLRISFLIEIAMLALNGVLYLLIPRIVLAGWPFPSSVLVIQASGAGFLAFAVFTFHAYRENDLARARPVGGLLTVFAVLELVVLAFYAGDMNWGSPLAWLFVVWMVTLIPPGMHALFGRNVLRFRLARGESTASPHPVAQSQRSDPPGHGLPDSAPAIQQDAQGAPLHGGPGGASKGGPSSSPDSVAGSSGGVCKQSMEERPWFRHWPPGVPRSIEYPDILASELLRQTARRYPERPAIRFYRRTLSYRELDAAADRFASGLRNLGVRPGDRVSLPLPNIPQFLIAFNACWRAGAIVVQTNPLYTPRELEKLYNDAGVETVVTMDLFWPNFAEARSKTPVKRVVICDMADFLSTPLRQLYAIKKRQGLKKAGHWPLRIPDEPWVHSFKEVAAMPPGPMVGIPTAPDDVAVLQYTGGTTGVPKGAMLTHRNLVAGAIQSAAWQGKRAAPERIVGAVPGFHIFGLCGALLQMFRGDEMILEPDPRNFGHILKLIHQNRATIFAGPPTMYIALLRHPKSEKYDLRSLQLCIVGAAPLPSEVRNEIQRRIGGRIMEGYGLSECGAALSGPGTGPAMAGVGFPQSDTDAIILDPGDPSRVLATGEVGELAVRGPQVMKGYWNQPEETALTLRDGWLLTGDLAKMDQEGYFAIVERKKDMIDASGYKIYPLEVEEVLFMHPAVSEAAVVGVPDPYRGETVKAFVVLRTGASTKEQEIIAFCKERLAPYKVPKLLEFVPDLPKSLVGKVLRRELREKERAKVKPAR